MQISQNSQKLQDDQHGGNIYKLAKKLNCSIDDIIDFSSNTNPFGTIPELLDFLKQNITKITLLPEIDNKEIIQKFASYNSLNQENILAGNGSTQIIYAITQALKIKTALILAPTYADYKNSCQISKSRYKYIFAKEENNFNINPDLLSYQIKKLSKSLDKPDIVFICNPNNPTGNIISKHDIINICKINNDMIFVIDESYLPFVSSYNELQNISIQDFSLFNLHNVLVLSSMSKIFKIPGLRIGFAVSSKKIIKKIAKYILPWSVNIFAQIAVSFLLDNQDITKNFIDKTKVFLEVEKNYFSKSFEDSENIKLFPSKTSFILAKLKNKNSFEICEKLAQEKILIRNCANFEGLSNKFIRFSLKNRDLSNLLINNLKKII